MTERRARRREEHEERTLPHNLEAERSVLGAIMIDNSAYERVSSVIAPSHFFRDAHQRIYKAIGSLLETRHGSADVLTVKEALARSGELEKCDGPSYVASLTDGVPRSTNVKHYAAIVREKFLLREIIAETNRVLASAYAAEEPAATILATADRKILELQRDELVDRLVYLKDSARSLLNKVEWRVQHRGALLGVDTGFVELNAETFGWQPTDMIIVAARPSVGKTALALNTAKAAAAAGKRVIVFSFEMSREQLEYRLLSNVSGIALSRILGGALGDLDYPKLAEGWEALHRLDIGIDDNPNHTAQDIRAVCRRVRSEGGLDLVIVDYVQLIPGNLDRRGATRNEELTDISRRLKGIAKELGVPVIVLSQLKRTGGAVPQLEDLRESGSLEQDCDVAVLLHRKNHREGGITKAILAKQRNGPTGTVLLDFDRDTVTFKDAPQDATAPAEEPARPSTRRKYAIAAARRKRDEENPHLHAD